MVVPDLILNIDRIRANVTDFIRSNPITTASVSLGAPIVAIGVAKGIGAIRKRKKKKKKVKKKNGRRKTTGRKTTGRKRKTHRSPRHRGHKRVSFTTKGGKKVSFLVAPKGGTKHRRKKRK